MGNICHDGWGTTGERKEGDFIFRPTQVNIVLVPPGQDLPLHQDNQWYWGINQLSQPDWLLHTVQESGLYKDKMIPQAQGKTKFNISPSYFYSKESLISTELKKNRTTKTAANMSSFLTVLVEEQWSFNQSAAKQF